MNITLQGLRVDEKLIIGEDLYGQIGSNNNYELVHEGFLICH